MKGRQPFKKLFLHSFLSGLLWAFLSSHRCTDSSYFGLRRGNWSRESYSYPSVMVVQALWQQTPLALKTEGLILTATATSTAALYFIRQGIKTQREKNVHKFAFFSFYTSLNSPHSSLFMPINRKCTTWNFLCCDSKYSLLGVEMLQNFFWDEALMFIHSNKASKNHPAHSPGPPSSATWTTENNL